MSTQKSGAQTHRSIAPVVRKVKLTEQTSDFAYWQAQPYEARLAALDEIRQEYYGWTDETEPRLQRVCRIVKRQ
jgi:hypothetical protein